PGGGVRAGPARARYARHAQALHRPWGYTDRFAHRPPGDHSRVRPSRLARARSVPRRHRRRGGRGDERAHRVPRAHGVERSRDVVGSRAYRLLRDSLRFPGLVVTDALMMGAIVTKYGAGEATVRAFLAGSDLLLIPADPDSAVLAMTAAVAAGRVTPQRLAQSVRRVLEIKCRLGLFERRTVPLDSIPHVVGSKRFQDAANDIAVRSLTLVRDVGGRLHALRGHPGRLALIAYADEANGSVGLFLTDLLRQGGDTVEYFRLWPM